MQFVLRQEGDTSNPTLARPYGHQSTRARVVLFDRDGDRTTFILLLAQGGRYGCDGIDEYHYEGTLLPEFEVGHEGDEDFRIWKFHPGTRSLGFTDPDQGEPQFFPGLGDTFTEKCYLEVKLPSDISPAEGEVPDGSEVFMRGLKVMHYDLVDGQLEESDAAFSVNNAWVGLDLLREVGKMPLSRFQPWAQSWKDYEARCDELIDWDKGADAGGVVEIPRHTANIVFPQSIGYTAAFEAVMMRSPGVKWQDVNGGIRILPNPDRDPVHTFNPYNILRKGVILTPPDPDNLFNYFIFTFRDIDDKDDAGNLRYHAREVPPVDLAKLRDANDGILNQFGPLELGLMNQSEAERIAWYIARTKTMLNAERDTAEEPIYPTQFEVKGQMDSFPVAKADYAEIADHYMVGLQTPLCAVLKETTHPKRGERTFVMQTTVRDAYRDTDHSEYGGNVPPPVSMTEIAGAGADDAAVGTVAWTNSGDITVDDSSPALAGLGGAATSHYLSASNFGFAIPTGATIIGVVVSVEKWKSGAGNVVDSSVRLVKAGVVSGDDKANVVTTYPTVETIATYGGSADMWSIALTPADVNASDFGVAFSAVGVSANPTARVDYISITVHYLP